MDIINIVATVHRTRQLVDVLLNERQIYLAKFSKIKGIGDKVPNGRYPLQKLLKYKWKNFSEKEKIHNKNIENKNLPKTNAALEKIKELKENKLTDKDVNLIKLSSPDIFEDKHENNFEDILNEIPKKYGNYKNIT